MGTVWGWQRGTRDKVPRPWVGDSHGDRRGGPVGSQGQGATPYRGTPPKRGCLAGAVPSSLRVFFGVTPTWGSPPAQGTQNSHRALPAHPAQYKTPLPHTGNGGPTPVQGHGAAFPASSSSSSSPSWVLGPLTPPPTPDLGSGPCEPQGWGILPREAGARRRRMLGLDHPDEGSGEQEGKLGHGRGNWGSPHSRAGAGSDQDISCLAGSQLAPCSGVTPVPRFLTVPFPAPRSRCYPSPACSDGIPAAGTAGAASGRGQGPPPQEGKFLLIFHLDAWRNPAQIPG